MHILLDILILGALFFCAWQGHRKGILLSAATLLAFILSIAVGSAVAGKFSNSITDLVSPMLGWVASEVTDEAADGYGRLSDITDDAVLEEIAAEAFRLASVAEGECDRLAEETVQEMHLMDSTLRNEISITLIRILAWTLLFLFAFAASALLMSLIINILRTLIDVPLVYRALPLVEQIGGWTVGALCGLALMFVVGFALRYAGLILGTETIEKTILLDFFVNVNPLAGSIKL